MKKLVGVIAVSFVGVAWATLPPPTPEAKAKAAEAAAKAAAYCFWCGVAKARFF